MATDVTTHTVVNGPRNLILSINAVSDGTGDWSNYELINVTDYTGEDQRQPNNFKVKSISGRNGSGTSFQLRFGSEGGNHRLFFESTSDDAFYEEWEGGLSTLLVDPNMTIRITTNGFETSGDTISIVIWLQKKTQGVSG